MARIIDIVRARRDAIQGNKPEATITGNLGTAAILAGIHTDAWRAYMAHFPGLNDAQLARLNADDGTGGDETLDKKRAYVVANGMCGPNSPDTQNLPFRVNSIDAGLDVCDPEPAE